MHQSKPVSQCVRLINDRLEEIANLHEGPLGESLRYCLLSSGKRLRPLLPLLIAEANEVAMNRWMDGALSLELIHSYSLIHDDLPSMDNDDYRRGRPSLHKAFHESLAILTGDYLLTHAFEILAGENGIEENKRLAMIQKLSAYAGSSGLVAGQLLDLYGEKKLPFNDLERLYMLKTSALFICGFEFAGIMIGASKEERKRLYTLGAHFGILFQYMDDWNDRESDEKEGARSCFSHLSQECSQQRINHHYHHFLTLIEQSSLHLDHLRQMAENLFTPLTELPLC